ncbi:hypothetical protein ACFX1X_026359 [Malus domestica]
MAEAEFEAILETHIGDPRLWDKLVWPYEKKGTYLVKSSYHWALTRNQSQRSLNLHTSATIPSTLWKIVWNLEIPPKLKCFMWKTLHAAIATMANLYQRRSSPSPLCLLCKSHEESSEHLFLQCPWVEVVWFGGNLNIRINRMKITTWKNWLIQMSDLANGSKKVRNNMLLYIAITCWHI